jgi:hypothetical protein
VRQTLDGHEPDVARAGSVLDLSSRQGKRVTGFEGPAALPSSRSKRAATTRSR